MQWAQYKINKKSTMKIITKNLKVKKNQVSITYEKIRRGFRLLDPRWNGLFLIICQNGCFYTLGNRSRAQKWAILAK